MPHALVVDDDKNTLTALVSLVEREGFTTTAADSIEAARAYLQGERPDVILCDLVLTDGQGTDLLRDREELGSPEFILITANASVETAVDALRLGAYDYLTKPVDVARLKVLLSQLHRTQKLKAEVSGLRRELRRLGRFGLLVGTSTAMQTIYDLIERVAPRSASVFISGESGTGKEIVAQTIHELSPRKSARFVPLNCGAVSPNLIESELFGHERGSFTGADRQHRGYFERAHGGTLFLDEVTEMPPELQVKLLRVLETGKVSRIGGDREIPVDVRIVSATNRDPEGAVKEGKLREDLFYRLKVFPIPLPPLRVREGDVALLARHFLAENNRAEGAGGVEKAFLPETLERLTGYHWPGNVRELRNLVERAYILADDEIGPECFPPEISGAEAITGPFLQIRVGDITRAEVERRLILATLHLFDGDKRKAAEVLGVSLKTLYNRLREYEEGTSQSAEAAPAGAGDASDPDGDEEEVPAAE